MRRALALAVAAFVLAAPARADTPEADLAYGAYQRGLYVTAFKEAMARLDRDPADAAAMTLLGELYNQGLGVTLDPEKAVEWYRIAGRLGDERALYALGVMAVDGRGMPKDPAKGRAWFEEAAEKGEPRASYNLALLLLNSEDAKDLQKAVELMRRAAESEIGQAQHALGVMTLRGRGVPRDPAEAAKWFDRAAKNGSVAGEVEYAILLFNGEGLTANEPQAAKIFRRAAMKGNAIAQNRLARLYVAGRGIPANRIEAAAWHLLAAAQGLTDPWLDDALKNLPPEDRARAEQIAADRMGTK